MLELEALSKEISSSTLLERANSLPEIPEAELNSPIETEGLDLKKQTQGLQGQEIFQHLIRYHDVLQRRSEG